MLYRLIAFMGMALIIFACETTGGPTPEPDPIVEVKFDSVEYLKATIDGVAYSGTVSSNAIVTPAGAGLVSVSFNSTSSGGLVTVFATVADTGKGEYTLGTGGNNILGLVHSGVSYTTRDGATATLNVDKIDVVQKRMKGRFSGTVKSTEGASKSFTEGTFEVKW